MTTSPQKTTPTRPFFDGPALGRALRLLRERAGLTQEALVDAMNVDRPDDRRVHRTGLIRWERHGRIYFPDLLHLLAVIDAAARERQGDEGPGEASSDDPSPEHRALDLLLVLVSRLDQLQESSIDKVDRLQGTVERRFEEMERQLTELRRLLDS